ncbi:MAG: hypothetical protein J7L08_00185 [Candidatus Aenigmarchaeota archaeon]|nr:hypothetical protein [Candidatus Aenigmarchaeota archaeon]
MADIKSIIEDGKHLDYPNSLIVFKKPEGSIKEIRKIIKDEELNTLFFIEKIKERYFVGEIRDSDDLPLICMDLDQYMSSNPENWIRVKDALREHRPEILKELGLYHEKSIYQ